MFQSCHSGKSAPAVSINIRDDPFELPRAIMLAAAISIWTSKESIMTPNEDITADLAAAVEGLALRFALEDDDEVVAADVRKLRNGIVAECKKLFPDLSDEADALGARLLQNLIGVESLRSYSASASRTSRHWPT
jgi:hypothetical protein